MKHETDDDREYTSEEVGDAMVDSYDAGAKAEREKIADWLDSHDVNALMFIAMAIRDGEHHSPDGSSSGQA